MHRKLGHASSLLIVLACGEPRDGTGTASGSGAEDGSGTTGSGADSGANEGSGTSSSGDGSSSGSSTNGSTTAGSSETGSTSSSSSSGSSTSSDDGGGVRLDVGPGMSTGGSEAGGCDVADPDCGCTAVDLLFVIDNSGSMCPAQAGLSAAFPSFVDAMYEALPPGTDLHVGLTTSTLCNNQGSAHNENMCEAGESQQIIEETYAPPTDGPPNWGGTQNGIQGRLLEHEGKTYYEVDTSDAAGRDGLKDWFGGAATSVGCDGCQFEFNASAAAYALHPVNATANAGFVRDEGAVLVIFILSDEVDQSLDVETAQGLHDMVTAAKPLCGGDACIVSGGLFNPTCVQSNQNNSFIFLQTFGEDPEWGSIGDQGNYTDVVGQALAQVVATTCEQIPPPVG